MSKRPHLRDCPLCHANGSDSEKISLMCHSAMDEDGDFYEIEYSVKCVICGVQVYHEYQDDLVHLWNGTKADSEDDSDA
jgi:hypothetical protein